MNASVHLPNALPRKGLLAQWREDVACVFQRDPAARSVFEVLTTYPGVHAVIVHRLSNRLWLAGWRYAARWLSLCGAPVQQCGHTPRRRHRRAVFIDHGACVVIGETAIIGDDVTPLPRRHPRRHPLDQRQTPPHPGQRRDGGGRR